MRAISDEKPPVWLGYTLSVEERMRRTIMFAIRSRGVSRADFKERYGIDPLEKFSKEFSALFQNGLIREEQDCLELTREGALHADGIALLFVSEEVKGLVRATNQHIDNPRRNLLERYDFSPI